MKGKSKDFCALKIDMSKANDKAGWSFLRLVMSRIGSPFTWINWVMTYVTSVSYSRMMDGRRIGYFKSSHGIWQGDPLLPCLFLLASNALSKMLVKASHEGFIEGIRVK